MDHPRSDQSVFGSIFSSIEKLSNSKINNSEICAELKRNTVSEMMNLLKYFCEFSQIELRTLIYFLSVRENIVDEIIPTLERNQLERCGVIISIEQDGNLSISNLGNMLLRIFPKISQ